MYQEQLIGFVTGKLNMVFEADVQLVVTVGSVTEGDGYRVAVFWNGRGIFGELAAAEFFLVKGEEGYRDIDLSHA